jgi:carbonic anhydrase
MIVIKPTEKESDFLFAKQLVKDYIRWLNIDLSFQDIDKELSDLSSTYGPPNGLFCSRGTKMSLRVA